MATALDFIFGDHIEDTLKESHPKIHPSRTKQDCGLLYPRSFSLKELGPIHSLQCSEQEFPWLIDNKSTCLGYTRNHGLTLISSNGTHRCRILEPCSCEDVNFDYSGEVHPLVLSLFHQPRVPEF